MNSSSSNVSALAVGRRRRLGIPILATLVAAVACSEPAAFPVSETPVVTVEDGTRTVRNRAPEWREGSGWTISPEPVLRIGRIEGEDPYLFDRVEGATRLSNGTVVVLNAGDGQLRFFGRDGRHLRSVGRLGDGPGEMRAPRWLDRLEGDALQVTHTAGRIRYGPDGELVQDDRLDWSRVHDVGRRAAMAGSAGFLMESCDVPAPLFLDDSVLLCGSTNSDVRFMPEQEGVHPSYSMVVRAGWELEAVDTVGIFATRSVLMFRDDGRLRPWGLGRAWRPRGWLRVSGSPTRLTFATSERYRMEVYDLETGAKSLVVEREGGLRTPTAEELENLDDPPRIRSTRFEPPPARLRAQIGSTDSLSVLIGAPLVDAIGALWAPVSDFGGLVPHAWDVFDREGIYLGRIPVSQLPAEILEIGEDYLLGIERGEFGEQYVVMYGVERGAG